MPKLKKRPDGRYRKKKTINGKVVEFYGRTLGEIDRKIEEYERHAAAPAKFKEIAAAWKAGKWKSFSITTQKGYNAAYNRAVEHFGAKYAADITTPMINRYLLRFINAGKALKTVQAQKTVISSIYEYAIINGTASENPARGFEIQRNLPRTKREAPPDDVIQKIATAEYEWLYPRLLLFTGLRRGEALALTGADFDRKNKTIRVDKTVVYDKNQPIVVNRTKTEAGTRTIPLPDALTRYLPPKLDGTLFPYTYSQLRRMWARWAKSLDIEVSMHQLRHAYASMLLDADVSAKDAQPLLGHAHISTTQDVYTHILQSRDKKTAAKVNAYLDALTAKAPENDENGENE